MDQAYHQDRDVALWRLPAWRIAELVGTRVLSPVDVLDTFLARIAALEPELHCFFTLAAEQAREQARNLDEALAGGAVPGPLCGVPFSIKDQYETAGIRTTGGSLLYRDFVPAEDATVVVRLKAAGAVLVGKTTTPEFAMFWRTATRLQDEETRNPWDTAHTACGSSGGAAASVAARMTPFAIGSDGGGSIRLPSSACGVLGLHPGLGRVSRHGGIGGAQHFDGVGPITHDARDAALIFDVISGADPLDPVTVGVAGAAALAEQGRDLSGLRVGWWKHDGEMAEGQEAGILDVVQASLAQLSALGCDVSMLREPMPLETYLVAFQCISKSDRYGLHAAPLFTDPDTRTQLAPYVVDNMRDAERYTGADYARAMQVRFEAMAEMHRIFERFDVIASPTLGFTPPVVTGDLNFRPRGYMTYSFLANFTGLSSLSLPCGAYSGMPCGLQLTAPSGSEGLLLALASRFLNGASVPTPPIAERS